MVSTYGTERWIQKFGWKVDEDWHHWHLKEGTKQEVRQVAGYRKVYDGLIFQTVLGVGHMAPQWARKQSLQMINDFIFNEFEP